MAIKTIYLGSEGPFKYDDQVNLDDPDGLFPGIKQGCIVTDGDLQATVVQTVLVGNGNPTGGAIGQILRKKSTTDYDVEWSRKIGGASHYTEFEADGTITFVGDATVWDDIRIVPGSFDRPGSSDPAIVSLTPSGTGTATWFWEFAKNNIANFSVQLPHGYKAGSDIYVHIHWTPGNRGNEENGATVGWKIDYTWANINSNFGAMAQLDLSDACDGTDWKHQMTPDVSITGTSKSISSMLICNISRTDTGTDDTWAGTATGSLPLLLEVDFHFELDTIGSRSISSK